MPPNQYLYCKNGDGRLFDVGIMRPSDFDKHGAIQGQCLSPLPNPPNHSHIHPHTPFTYSHLTEPDDLSDLEQKKGRQMALLKKSTDPANHP
jgi:hypothetical protein